MSLPLMVVGVGVVVALLAYGRWRLQVNFGLGVAAKWLWKFIIDPKTCSVAETFCNEVAVLWFVFPLLDTIYEHGKHDDPLLRQAFKIAAMFFIFAIVLSHASKPTKEDHHE